MGICMKGIRIGLKRYFFIGLEYCVTMFVFLIKIRSIIY